MDGDKRNTRTFKVKLEENGTPYGRYYGISPFQAASKALSEIIKKNKQSDQLGGAGRGSEPINFYLIETTKGSSKKIHQYAGNRVKLENPVEYTVGGNTITKEYKNILKKIKKNEL